MATVEFIYGLEYLIKQSFSHMKDPYSFFTGNTKVVFINRVSVFFDKADLSHYELHFYNTLSGLSGYLKCQDDKELIELSEKFELTGGWKHPVEGEINIQALDELDSSNSSEILQSFIPYFKSIIEGDINTENWFYWLERNAKQIKRIMTPMELLKLKTDTFTELKRILDEYNTSYQLNPRYGWLSRKSEYHTT